MQFQTIFYLSLMKKIVTLSFAVLFCTLFQNQLFSQCTPFYGQIVINEFMPANSAVAADEFGEYDDWVELHNTTDEPIDLTGWFLSDNHGNRTKFVFPQVSIDGGGYLIIWCDGQPAQGDLHTAFKLSSSGEELGLYNPDSTSVDYVRFGNTPSNVSIGRYPNGSGPMNILVPTFDGPNTNAAQPGLVINEYQAINETTAQDQWGEYADWVELYNNSPEPINLNGYFLSDKIGDPTQFQFPDTVMEPDSYLIIWCDQGLMEPGLHTFFKLGSDGDDLLLSDADTLTLDYVRFGPQIPDDSEGRYGNGTGPITCLVPTFEASNGEPSGLFEIRQSTKALDIWPNPARNYLRLNWPQSEPATPLQIFDIKGVLVGERRLSPGENRLGIHLNAGIYILKAGEYRSKLVVW